MGLPKKGNATKTVSNAGLPEAPASANFFVKVGGFRAQVTVRSFATERDIQAVIENLGVAVEAIQERGGRPDGGASSNGTAPATKNEDGVYPDQHFIAYELTAEFANNKWYWKVVPDMEEQRYPSDQYPINIYEALEEFGIDKDELDPEHNYPLVNTETGTRIRAYYVTGEQRGKSSPHPYAVIKLEDTDIEADPTHWGLASFSEEAE